MRRARLAVGFVAAAACSPPPSIPDGGESGCGIDGGALDAGACPLLGRDVERCMDLRVGTGGDGTYADFAELTPGGLVYVEPGSQGLQHIVLALRGTGFDPTRPLVQVRVLDASNCNEVGYVRFRLAFVQDPDDATRLALPGVRVVLDDDADPYEYCTILGRDVNAIVDLDDGAGHTAHREIRVHVGGIDPAASEALRDAWLSHCAPRDGGADR